MVNDIDIDKWYYRILNIFYLPLRIILMSLFVYVLLCITPFAILIMWIIKGD